MSTNILTTAHLQAKSKEARDKALAIFGEITENSRANEKEGVIRYITCVPLDASNETSIYMIEQYKDRAASDAHFVTAPVQKLIKFFGDEAPLIGPPEIFELNPIVDSRRQIENPTPDTMLILAHIVYKSDKLSSGLSALKELISNVEKTEPEFLGCAVCEDKTNNTLRVCDVFESESFYEQVHVKSEAIQKFHQINTPFATGEFGFVKLRVVHGFLGRYEDGTTSKL